ncbi:MAG: HEAT repeat domain-containing protein [Fidelibacterota bacterium]
MADSLLHEGILTLLIVFICIFFIMAIFFAIATIYLRISNDRKSKIWQGLEQKWEEHLLMILSEEETHEALWEEVGKNESLYFIDFLLRFSQRLKGMEQNHLIKLAKPFLKPIADRLHENDIERRARAVLTLSSLGLKEYDKQIVASLDDPSPLVAMVAIRALASQDSPEYAPHIMSHLHRFENWSKNFLTSLLKSIGPNGTPAFRKTFSDSKATPISRATAAQALRNLNDLLSADIAADVITKESDRDLLAASLKLLAQVGQEKHLPAIRNLITSPDFVVRACALKALGVIGEENDLELIKPGLDDPIPWVAIQAVEGLMSAGGQTFLHEIAHSNHPRANLAQQVLAENRR